VVPGTISSIEGNGTIVWEWEVVMEKVGKIFKSHWYCRRGGLGEMKRHRAFGGKGGGGSALSGAKQEEGLQRGGEVPSDR